MQARHYSPALGRFLQPDPDRSEANLYAYAANNPVTEIDPDGTCFIVCQLVIGAVIDAVSYAVTTDSFSLGGMAQAVVGGAVESAVNPLAKLNKVSKLVKATSKVLSKVPKAKRYVQRAIKRSRSEKNNSVYWSKKNGSVEYVGITNNAKRRKNQHGAVGRQTETIQGMTRMSRFDAHSVEQALIRRHRMVEQGGTLSNKINSVSRRDPLYGAYLARGHYLLGKQSLKARLQRLR